MARPRSGPLLTRDRIVRAALDLVDRGGLDGLSMRKLATALKVDPMAIYHHIPNKDALIRALVEAVFSEMPAPSARGDWKRRVRAWAEGYRSVVAAHPNLVLRIVSDPAAVAVAAVRANEALYAALDASGLPPRAVVGAADLIVDYVNGYCLSMAAPVTAGVDAAEAWEAELSSRPAETTAAQRRVFALASGERDSFRFGLDVIMSGLESTTRARR